MNAALAVICAFGLLALGLALPAWTWSRTRSVVAGFTTLRFTHAQVAYERARVRATLAAVAARLG